MAEAGDRAGEDQRERLLRVLSATASEGERVCELALHRETPLGEMATELWTARLSRPCAPEPEGA